MSTGNVSDSITELVLSVLPNTTPGLTYNEVHQRIGMWSKITVKHALRQLREAGLVERCGPHNSPGFYLAALTPEPKP